MRRRVGHPEVEPTVRAPPVVVSHVLTKHSLEVTATKHERPVEALTPDGPHPALGEGIGLRGSEWGEHGANAVGREDGVEAPRVLGVAIADQEPERPTLGEVEGEVPGLLGHPRRIRTPRRCGNTDAPGVDLDDEEHVQRTQPRRLHGEEVGGEDTPGLAAQELAPRRSGSPWGRAEAMATQQRSDGRRRDPHPELGELSFNPQASPPRVLPSYSQDESPEPR